MTSQRKFNSRASDLAKIHIAKKDLGLDDETYRAMLWTLTRVQSSADLDDAGRAKVLAHLSARGFKAKTKQGKPVSAGEDAQIKMIRGLWLELHAMRRVRDASEKALQSYVLRQTKVARLAWLNSRQIETVIESLKKWRDRPDGAIKNEVQHATSE